MSETSPEAPVLDPPPSPPPAPPPTAEFARPAALGSLASVGLDLDRAIAAVATAQAAAATWTDDFWAVSGYDKGAVLDALAELEKLTRIYAGQAGLSGMQDFSADAAVLADQAPA